MRSKRPVLLALPLVFASTAACNEDGASGDATLDAGRLDDGTAGGTTAGDAGSDGSVGSSGPSDGGTAGADEAADGGTTESESTTGTSTTGDSGAETGTERPPMRACDYALGCHSPAEPDDRVGRQSHVPVACEGENFRPTASLDLIQLTGGMSELPRALPMLADLDGDDTLDLLLNPRKGIGMVFRGTGDGDFEGQPMAVLQGGFAFGGGWGGDVGDIDGNGKLDVVLGDHTRGALAYTNSACCTADRWSTSGNFEHAFDGLPGGLFTGAGLADLTGNGLMEAVFGHDQFSSGVDARVYEAGTWTTLDYPTIAGSDMGYHAFADYDDDGDIDAFHFGGGAGGMTAFVVENDLAGGGGMRLHTTLTAPRGGGDVSQGHVIDLNCDGIVDVTVGGTVFLAQSPGNWTQSAEIADTNQVHLADMNGDGHLDAVAQSAELGLALFYGDGTGTGWTRDTWSGLPGPGYAQFGAEMDGGFGLDIGDVNGNGRLDIVRTATFGDEPDGLGSTNNITLVEAWTW